MQRQFLLPEQDVRFLEDYGLPWEAVVDGSMWVLIHNFSLPEGYNHEKATVAIRIETGYPNTQLDMVYFNPTLKRLDGKTIKATSVIQKIDGKDFQRWSRHRSASNPWIPGQDDLFSHITLVEDWLSREFKK